MTNDLLLWTVTYRTADDCTFTSEQECRREDFPLEVRRAARKRRNTGIGCGRPENEALPEAASNYFERRYALYKMEQTSALRGRVEYREDV